MDLQAIILGKQWKSESDETKLHFRNLAEELKKKHAEDHPDYQYSPRKPSENESSPSTNGLSNVSTPAMYPDMPMGDSTITGATFGGVFASGDVGVHARNLEFDPEAFDTFLRQVQNDHHYNKNATIYQQFSYPDVSDCF
ncbi:mating type protein MAT1-2-1 [Aspergillus terreus]|uniref:Mating type protein MAT1-2-1 n=1 Tax=Aspergillus terreus TaxID=33178 RepID=A0A5M3Z9Q3_ASPTE|nr:hypothetical protein ATETN484_0012033200 [Aspergillus terreus]GFF19580.1 mating type protein MAT1-2-1 [Aspergillus terreus]